MKDQIIEKTANLFKVYGIRSNTMDDVAREAGISKKTLYQYINDKEDLIQLVIDYEYKRTEALIGDIKKQSINPIDSLIQLNFMIIEFMKEINPASINDLKKHFKLKYLSSSEKFQNLFFHFIDQNFNDGKQSGIYRNDINNKLIAQLHSERIQQITESKKIWDVQHSTPEIIKDMTAYYIRGLVTEEGEILLNKHMNEFDKYLNK